MTAILKEKKNYEKKGNNMSCPHGNPIDFCDTCSDIDAAYKEGFAVGKLEQWNEFAGMEPVDVLEKSLTNITGKVVTHYDAGTILIRRPERKTE